MFGILLAATATLIGEAGQTLSKKEVAKKNETPAEMAFINMLFATGILILIVFFVPNDSLVGNLFGGYQFDIASLPFFVARFFLELLVMYLVVIALTKATRATFSFLRLVTLPLLLAVDILLGYELSSLEIIGILVVVLTTSSLFFTRTLKTDGMWYVIGGSVVAVMTISLYKFNITNFNSVAGEQITMLCALIVTLFTVCMYQTRQNPLRHLTRPRGLLQAVLAGFTSVIASVALSLAAASIIMTVKRVSAIFWAILSGRHFFHEQHTAAKLAGLGILSVGILLLAGLS